MNETTSQTGFIGQVVRVEVSGDMMGQRYSDGESLLKEQNFTNVRVCEKKPSSIEGTAPDNEAETFVLLERIIGQNSVYPTYRLYRVDRETKHPFDTIDIRFSPDRLSDGMLSFSGTGSVLGNWEVIVKEPSPAVLAKAALFPGDKLTIRTIEVIPQIEADANTYSLAGRVEPITRLRERNPLFVQFIHDYGNDDFSVTAVADTVAAYMKSKAGMTVSAFSRKFKETNEGVFQQLMAISRLSAELRPLLNVTLAEEQEGKERLGLSVAAQIAKVPLKEQYRAWEKIKKLPTHDKRFTAIKKIRKQIEQEGTF
ncbi:MAG: hypothetical protein PHG25_03505 [Candidatus Pacebacteria bacterium]|nr:hypothetical protein [Candidatus Paceibacterota bacterium]